MFIQGISKAMVICICSPLYRLLSIFVSNNLLQLILSWSCSCSASFPPLLVGKLRLREVKSSLNWYQVTLSHSRRAEALIQGLRFLPPCLPTSLHCLLCINTLHHQPCRGIPPTKSPKKVLSLTLHFLYLISSKRLGEGRLSSRIIFCSNKSYTVPFCAGQK